ncbi:Ig-like domain-containing protein [Colwellia sp. MSW7]|uniref:Ig-like domain-containing protein n=1 Tax=Colwellia maritima TaxID=2912588 RepID=A0ABS9WWT5_9GAMM|nr:Ig-like domain-containing protein [Colwellia maritima]MCI2282240.1 Ig-like domain-containing protein [Colwellia maritima]
MQESPDDGVPKTGALMHTSSSHGEGRANFIASPWMSALLIDAVERYSIHIEEDSISDFVIKMAKYFQQENVALYNWVGYTGKEKYFVPYYLAGKNLTEPEHGGIGFKDLEHGIDVIKIFSSAYFYSCFIGDCDESFLYTISRLYTTAFSQIVPYWIRPDAPSLYLSSYRLGPPRKFNWWFNITANNDFLLGKETSFSVVEENTPLLKLVQDDVKSLDFKPGDEITFSFRLKNIGSVVAKNIVIKARTKMESPGGLIEIHSISKDGANRSGEIIWHLESIKPNQELTGFSFIVQVKDFPVLQTKKRPLGNIISYAEVNYCSQADTVDNCQLWDNLWASGEQTHITQSNWISIAPIFPTTPPVIQVVSPLNFEMISGRHNVIAEIEDDDGIAKVDFLLDGEIINTLTLPPYQTEIQFDALSPEMHELIIKAWDVFGSEASQSVVLEAKFPDIVAPQITILSPEEQQRYCKSVGIKYEVEDKFSVNSCQIALNDNKVSVPDCGELTIPSVIPLFLLRRIFLLMVYLKPLKVAMDMLYWEL